MTAHQPPLHWGPALTAYDLGSLPEWGGGMFLHAMSRAGLSPRGVVAGPGTVLFHLPEAHTHHR
jgi:hypothetical protein